THSVETLSFSSIRRTRAGTSSSASSAPRATPSRSAVTKCSSTGSRSRNPTSSLALQHSPTSDSLATALTPTVARSLPCPPTPTSSWATIATIHRTVATGASSGATRLLDGHSRFTGRGTEYSSGPGLIVWAGPSKSYATYTPCWKAPAHGSVNGLT